MSNDVQSGPGAEDQSGAGGSRDMGRLGSLAAWACANGIRPGICRPVSGEAMPVLLQRLSKVVNLRDHLGRIMEQDADLFQGVRIRITVDLG